MKNYQTTAKHLKEHKLRQINSTVVNTSGNGRALLYNLNYLMTTESRFYVNKKNYSRVTM